ncbi:MAG: CrcB family protein [Euzebyales bacterium]|nr:CrcB family protein [Euzebyales bacterium]
MPLPPVGSVVAVAVGGALGVGLRYAVVVRYAVGPGGFPWPTLAVNFSGAFALGLVLTLFVERWPSSRHRRALVCIGLLGAYTTFSTVAVELATLLVDGHVATAAGYATVTLVAGLGAALLGIALARGRPTGSRP